MMLTILPWFSAASFLFSLVALVAKRVHASPFDQTATCGGTEICFLQSNQLPEITCDCSPSIQCSWNGFADRREIFSNGTTESVLMWQRTGYGQYICVRDSSTEVRNIMILPQTQGQSCDTCISTRVCMTGGKTYLNYTLLFDESLIYGQRCELLLNGINLTDTINVTEQSCVELSSNSDYTIRCPLCPQAVRDVYHVIPNSIFANFEDCLGICNAVTPTSSTAASSAVTIESSSAVTTMASVLTTSKSTVITPTVSSTSVLETTTIPTVSSVEGNSDDVGAIIGGVVGGVTLLVIVVVVVVLVCRIYIKKLCKGDSRQSTPDHEAPTGNNVDTTCTSEASPGTNRSNDSNINTTGSPETPAGMNKPDDDHSNQQSKIRAPLDPACPDEADQVGQSIGDQASISTNYIQTNQQSKITGDDSSLTDTKISELLDFDPAQLKAAIPRLHVTIKEYINFDSLNPFLDKYEVFTRDEMQYFTTKYHSDSDKVSNLIEWLHKKGGRGIHNFVRALKGAEEHSGHFEIIKDLHICTVGTTV